MTLSCGSSELVRIEGNTLVFPKVEISHVKSKNNLNNTTLEQYQTTKEFFDIRIEIQNFSSNLNLSEEGVKTIRENAANLFNLCYDPGEVKIQYSNNPEQVVFDKTKISKDDLDKSENQDYTNRIRRIWDSIFDPSKIVAGSSFFPFSGSNPSSQNPKNGTPSSSSTNSAVNANPNPVSPNPSVDPATNLTSSSTNASSSSQASQLQNSGPTMPVNTSSNNPTPAPQNVSDKQSFDPKNYKNEEVVVQDFIRHNEEFKNTFPNFSMENLRKEASSITNGSKLPKAYQTYCDLLWDPNDSKANVALMRALFQHLYAFKLYQVEHNDNCNARETEKRQKLAAELTTCFIPVDGMNPEPLAQWLIDNSLEKN